MIASTLIRPGGIGLLSQELEALKRKLQAEGLFDAARKRPIPLAPQGIAIVTSRSGAVLHDVIRVLRGSAPQTRLLLVHAPVQGATAPAELAEATGLPHDHILLSAKTSNVRDLFDVYTELAGRCDYPLHLGLTEAGMGMKGIVATSAALGHLLNQGIGDTIRVSLTPEPGADRALEVEVAQQILQSLGLRAFSPQVTSCPGCGRTTSTFFQEMAQEIQAYLKARLPEWRPLHPGVENLEVAVMGCVVNGPGESKHANLGISLPGTFEEPVAPVFQDGALLTTLRGDRIVAEFLEILERYVQGHYPSR